MTRSARPSQAATSSPVRWLVHRDHVPADAAFRASAGQPLSVARAMQADGLLRELGAGIFLPADADVSRDGRARAFVGLLPQRTVLAMAAAAWVHGGPVPSAPFVVATGAAVVPRQLPPGFRARQTVLPGDHVVHVAGLAVTSAARTAADLARWGEGTADRRALHWLLSGATGLPQARAALATQPRGRHARRARQRLHAVGTGREEALWPDAPSR